MNTSTVNSGIVIAAASVINNFIELWLSVLRFLFPFIAYKNNQENKKVEFIENATKLRKHGWELCESAMKALMSFFLFSPL